MLYGILGLALQLRWLGEIFLSISFSDSEGKDFWFSRVYGPSRPRGREAFWEELGDLYGYCGSRWRVAGDFNEV